MKFLTRCASLIGLGALAACAATPGEDYGFDSKKLTDLQAAVWTDPNGCQHWLIADGAEGYLTPRLASDGRPVCPGVNVLKTASGNAGVEQYDQQATLWTDPNGCQHWVSDHGITGYMSPRLSRDGNPVCPGRQAPPKAQTITLNADALFDTDKFDLRPEAVAELNDFGSKAQRLGKKRLFIQGHTDSRASDAYNQRLSERRASSVAAYLQRNYGLVSQIEGKGEAVPVASNDTRDGRQANRRVEITVLD